MFVIIIFTGFYIEITEIIKIKKKDIVKGRLVKLSPEHAFTHYGLHFVL